MNASFEDGELPGSPFAEPRQTVEPIPLAEVAYPAQPPLGIGHLMLWMAGSGLLLAVYRRFIGSDLPRSGWLPIYVTASSVIFSILGGVAVSSLILAVVRRLRGGPAFPCQPGHWLLFGMGGVVAVQSAGYVCVWIAHFVGLGADGLTTLLAVFCGQTAGLILFGIACYRVGERSAWRVLLAVIAAHHGLTALVYAAFFLARLGPSPRFADLAFYLGPLAVLIGMTVVLVLDRARARTRDWLHWTGVAAQGLLSLFSLISTVTVRILQHLFPLS